jgi:hypothetical protein
LGSLVSLSIFRLTLLGSLVSLSIFRLTLLGSLVSLERLTYANRGSGCGEAKAVRFAVCVGPVFPLA